MPILEHQLARNDRNERLDNEEFSTVAESEPDSVPETDSETDMPQTESETRGTKRDRESTSGEERRVKRERFNKVKTLSSAPRAVPTTSKAEYLRRASVVKDKIEQRTQPDRRRRACNEVRQTELQEQSLLNLMHKFMDKIK